MLLLPSLWNVAYGLLSKRIHSTVAGPLTSLPTSSHALSDVIGKTSGLNCLDSRRSRRNPQLINLPSSAVCFRKEKNTWWEGVGMYHVTAQQTVGLLKKHICYYSHFLPEEDSFRKVSRAWHCGFNSSAPRPLFTRITNSSLPLRRL